MATPIQKVQDVGYLLIEADSFGDNDPAQTGFVLVATKNEWAEGQLLESGFAVYSQKVTYKGLNGFDQTVYAFKTISDDKVYTPL